LGQAESAKTLKKKLRSKRQEYKRIRKEAKEKDNKAERAEHKRKKKIIEQEIFRLRNEIRAAKEGRAEDEPTVATGALPDFVIIGTMKGGTSFFYHLLSQHPLVELCAKKELHFFDALFDEGIEWYRQCFPAPRLKDGHRTITGEATPGYMFVRRAPERMAPGREGLLSLSPKRRTRVGEPNFRRSHRAPGTRRSGKGTATR
jgi:hypothetical protein